MNTEIVNTHREIVEKSIQGNQLAMYQLYQKYCKAMYNICYRMMNNREEAEDVLQEAFTVVFAKLSSFRFESTIGAWIKQIVVNRCINAINKRRPDLKYDDEMERFDRPDDESEIDESDIQMSVEKVRLAMGALPDGYRVIFSLYAFEGYDHQEIAEIMGVSESTSKSQFMRAKRKILEMLKKQEYER